MSINVTPTVKFTNNMQLALQQTRSKLAPYALQQAGDGELTEITNLVTSIQPQRQSTRFQTINLRTNDFQRRWAPKLDPYWDARGFDSQDKLLAAIDLQGAATRSLAAMIARAKDIAFLEGFYGPNQVGKNGTQQVTFAAGNIIPVNQNAGGPVGLTVDKLVAARRILRENEVDMDAEECYMAITADQEADLLRQTQMVSRDFNPSEAPVLRDGRLTRLLGFNFIMMEFGNAATVGAEIVALTVDGSGHRRVPFWAKSGMAMVTWEDMFARVSEREDLHYAAQAYARTTVTASRTEEGKCGQVMCLE